MKSNSFKTYLREELVRRCKSNPSYSLRAYAKHLSIDHSTLAKILNGKRPLGKHLITRLGTKLKLNPKELSIYLKSDNDSLDSSIQFQELAFDSFKIIAEWQHAAILELIRVENFENDPKWISNALGISINEVHAAIERLSRVQLIKVKEDGSLELTIDKGTTCISPGFTSSAHKLLQKQILEKAILALEDTPVEFRDQTSVTMAINFDLLPEAIVKIKNFRRDLAQYLSRSDKCTEVYQLSISLFPLTKSIRSFQ